MTFRMIWIEANEPQRFDGGPDVVEAEMVPFVQSEAEWDRLRKFLDSAEPGQALSEGERYSVRRIE